VTSLAAERAGWPASSHTDDDSRHGPRRRAAAHPESFGNGKRRVMDTRPREKRASALCSRRGVGGCDPPGSEPGGRRRLHTQRNDGPSASFLRALSHCVRSGPRLMSTVGPPRVSAFVKALLEYMSDRVKEAEASDRVKSVEDWMK
jgi:hypothetical protein